MCAKDAAGEAEVIAEIMRIPFTQSRPLSQKVMQLLLRPERMLLRPVCYGSTVDQRRHPYHTLEHVPPALNLSNHL